VTRLRLLGSRLTTRRARPCKPVAARLQALLGPYASGMSSDAIPVPRSLVWATDLDVLPLNRVVERRSGFLVVRSPGNPAHYWGNLLLFDREPVAGDASRWEALFAEAFGDEPRVRHRTFAWDRTDGVPGAAREEFADRGYDVTETIGLVADPQEILPHPRGNREVTVQALDPAIGAGEALWDAVVELQVAGRDDGHEEKAYRSFARARLEDLRALFRAGRGTWYVAIEPSTGEVVGSCGVVVTGGRGRFQAVDTALAYRRRGISSRLVVEAARRASEDYGAKRLVIVADADYHALGLYESLGFKRAEHVFGVCFWSRTDSPS
jgi:ribosomal protein S18 acetylase RimI-like enzyme